MMSHIGAIVMGPAGGILIKEQEIVVLIGTERQDGEHLGMIEEDQRATADHDEIMRDTLTQTLTTNLMIVQGTCL